MRPITLLCGVALSLLLSTPVIAQTTQPSINHSALVKLAWQLACRSSTFHEMTFQSMAHLLHGMTVHHIELVPGQILSDEHKDVVIGPEMSDSDTVLLLAELKATHMDVVSVGPVTYSVDRRADVAGTRKLLGWAKKLHAKNVVVQINSPGAIDLAGLDQLAGEFGVVVAVEGHAAPAFSGSAHLGSVLDLSNADASMPLTDIREVKISGRPTELAPWNTVLTKLRDRHFKGIFSIGSDAGRPQARLEQFVKSVNAFSQSVTQVTSGN